MVSLEGSQLDATFSSQLPSTSLSLSLAALLILIPVPDDVHAMMEAAVTLRRAYAGIFARSALQRVENEMESSEISRVAFSAHSNITEERRSSLHSDIPLKLEPVLALCLLSMYECCERNDVSKMRMRANQALTTAMDLSLHLMEGVNVPCSEAQRRSWWMIVSYSFTISVHIPLLSKLTVPCHNRCFWFASHQL